MKYRTEIDIAFDEENDAIALCNLVEEIKNKACTDIFKGGIGNVFKCKYHKCTHDEEVPIPCTGSIYVDFKKVEKDEHKNEKGEVINYKTIDVTTETSLSSG